jgi:23S rRNA (adenine-N6)-dimethyltransferase
VAARSRGGSVRPAGGRHFLRSARLAEEIVASAEVGPGELVVELGAGFGRLTAPLARAGARVVAVELDPSLAASLRRRFAGGDVTVVEADILTVPQPTETHRAVGNIPFGITTPILHRILDDIGSPLQRADLIVQAGFARKRTAIRPSTLLALGWLPWWSLQTERELPAACFDPPPQVHAALVTVRRRHTPLLGPARAGGYRAFLREAFTPANRPVRRTVPISPLGWKRFARDRGLALDARPHDLDVWDWVGLYLQSGRE